MAAASGDGKTNVISGHLDFMGYAVEWSPFDENKLAVATAQNFGIIGTGKQHVFQVKGNRIVEVAAIETKDGVYDCAWSEANDMHLVFASGDGSVNLWDLKTNKLLRTYKEHTAEVYAVDWNLINKETIISGAWDNSIKLWHPDDARSIRTFREHTHCIYATIWHPRHADVFASVSGDCTLKIWDVNDPKSTLTLKAHNYEVLTVDWNKYNEYGIVTGSVDKSIRTWDTRQPRGPVSILNGHAFAVRRLKCSPHNERTVASCSYDMSTCIWDIAPNVEDALVARYDHHTEFVLGVDFNLMVDGRMADCSWDESVSVYQINKQFSAQRPANANAISNAAAGNPNQLSTPAAVPTSDGKSAPAATGTGFSGALSALANSLSTAAATAAGAGAAASTGAAAAAGSLAPPPLLTPKQPPPKGL